MTMMNLQSNLTGQGLADFAEGRIGTPYFYGAKISHGILTEELHGAGKAEGTGRKSKY